MASSDDYRYLKAVALCHAFLGIDFLLGFIALLLLDWRDPRRWLLLFILVYGLALTVSGYWMYRRICRFPSILVASFTTLMVPIGTILGISTIAVLNRKGVRELYDPLLLGRT
jgi:hypothetical protein